MYDQILLATDGRPGTERAASYARHLSRRFDATLHVLTAIEPATEAVPSDQRDTVHEQFEAQAEATTAEVRDESTDIDSVQTHVRTDNPYRAVLDVATAESVDLIVMGVRGQAGMRESYLGSTTERVLVRSETPVLTVPATATEPGEVPERNVFRRVVVPTDGSDGASEAAEQGLLLAERYGADVRVIYVVDTNTYRFEDAPRSIVGLLKEGGSNAVDAIATDARERNLDASTAILRGNPADEIIDYANGVQASLITIGTRGEAAPTERVLGSVTARILQESPVPVLATA